MRAADWRAVSRSALQGMDPKDQKGIDEKMIALDGTDNKGKLRRQRDPGGLARGLQGWRGREGHPALQAHRGAGRQPQNREPRWRCHAVLRSGDAAAVSHVLVHE